MNYSKTYIGAIATLIASMTFLTEAEALSFTSAAVVVITTIITLYGRWRAGNITPLGFK